MLARKVSRRGSWFMLGCLLATLSAAPAAAINWWPFKKKPPPVVQTVQVLGATGADGSALNLPQYWDRNTLIVDLQALGSSGTARLLAPTEGRWPVRISFRTLVGQFAVLEVRGAQRVLIPVRADGAAPVVLPLDPAAWTQATAQLELSWGAGLPAPN